MYIYIYVYTSIDASVCTSHIHRRQWTATCGDVMQMAAQRHTFLRGSIRILLLAADGYPAVEHDRVRVEHVLRPRLELECSTRLHTRVLDQLSGCGTEL